MFDNCPTIELNGRAAISKGRPFQVAGGPIDAYTEGFCDCAEEARAAVESAPIVDAEPVVRCHECANHTDTDGEHYCKFWRMYCPDDSDFFCKAGKRKEAAHEVSRS